MIGVENFPITPLQSVECGPPKSDGEKIPLTDAIVQALRARMVASVPQNSSSVMRRVMARASKSCHQPTVRVRAFLPCRRI